MGFASVGITLEVTKAYRDIVKIIGKVNMAADNVALYRFMTWASFAGDAKLIIAINMGVVGQLSRILNMTFMPVTHPLLPTRAAPGQLSFIKIQKALHLVGQLLAKQFYIFGKPIVHSMSPTLHNTAFNHLGLLHSYGRLETDQVDADVCATLAHADFGSASVTIPLKRDIMSQLDELTPKVKAIGAVNTVIPFTNAGGHRGLLGDNTTGWESGTLSRLAQHSSGCSTGFLMHLLGFDCFMSSKAVNGLAHAGHVANPYNIGILGNCRNLWTQGSKLGIEYDQVYKIPAEGLHKAKRRHEYEEDVDVSVSAQPNMPA